jgi:phage tail-like protein
MPAKHHRQSVLFDYLPAIYSDTGNDTFNAFLNHYLLAFEQVLLGSNESPSGEIPRGLEQIIDSFHDLLDAEQAPEEFLGWLLQWLSFSCNVPLTSAKRRTLIATLVPLYRFRGTKLYLQTLLRVLLDINAAIDEEGYPEFEIGVTSKVGRYAPLGGGAPHFFRVTIARSIATAAVMQLQARLTAEVIELAKPAHTTFEIKNIYPLLQLGIHSTLGVDTLLP